MFRAEGRRDGSALTLINCLSSSALFRPPRETSPFVAKACPFRGSRLDREMSRTRQAIIAFWVVIITLLIWEFYSYNTAVTKQEEEHPAQQHFYFIHTNGPTAIAPKAPREGADVEQVGFDIQRNTPSAGSFTCRVTVKNLGTAKAIGVQVDVRPYKGISLGDLDNGHPRPGTMSDNDAVAQIGQWVTFPDLAPGESASQSAVFLNRQDVGPGTNPQPEILFDTEKKTEPAPHLPPHKAPVD
jgi:hypothetical protein